MVERVDSGVRRILLISERPEGSAQVSRACIEGGVRAELRLVESAEELNRSLENDCWDLGLVACPVADGELRAALRNTNAFPLVALLHQPDDALCAEAAELGASQQVLWAELPEKFSALLPVESRHGPEYDPAPRSMDQHAQELLVLHGVATAAFEAKSEDELFERVTRLIADTLYPNQFGILLLNDETNQLRFHPSYIGLPPEYNDLRIDVGEGVTGRVAQTGQPLNVPDVSCSSIYLRCEDAIRSELCVPLTLKETVIGVINAESDRVNAFSADDERLLMTLAHQLEIAIERLRMEADLRKRVAQLAAIHDASQEIAAASLDIESVCRAIHAATERLLDFDAFAIVRWERAKHEIEAIYLIDDGQRFPPIRSKDEVGWSSYVLRTGASLRISDFANEHKVMPQPVHYGTNRYSRSVLVVPLKLGGRIIGTFSVQSYTPNRYTADDLNLLELMAGHAAIALENSRLYEEVSRQALTFANMFDAIIITDSQSRITDWNPAAERMFGYKREEVIGELVTVTHPPLLQSTLQTEIMSSLKELGRWEGETPIVRKDGTHGVADLIVLPVLGSDGQLIATVGVNRDITEHKKAEKALRNSEARLAGIIDSAMDAIVTVNQDGEIVLFNHAAEAIFGYSTREALGKPADRFIPASLRDQLKPQAAKDAASDSEGRVMRRLPYVIAQRANGEEFPAEFTVTRVLVEEQEYITMTVRDVTERVQAQLEMSRLAGVVEQAAESVVLADHLGRILYVNPYFERVSGFSQEDVQGKTVRILMSDFHDRRFYSEVWKTVTSGHPWTGTLASRRKDGGLLFESATLFPIKNESGAIVNYAAVKRDITDEIQREREMQAIVSVSTELRKASTRAEMLPIILDQLIDLLNAKGALIASYNAEKREFFVELGGGPLHFLTSQRVPLGKGITSVVFENDGPFQTHDINQHPQYSRLFELAEIRAVIGTPLMVQGETMGVLWVGRLAPFHNSEFRVLQAVADMSANALHRASLHERTLRHASQTVAISAAGRTMAEILNPADIYTHLSNSINGLVENVDILSIYAMDAARNVCSCVFVSCHGQARKVDQLAPVILDLGRPSPLDRVVRTHEPTIVQDLQHTLMSLAAVDCQLPPQGSAVIVPLVARGKVLGVVELISQTPNRFSAEDLDLLILMGSTAATALENANLYQGLQESNLELLEAYDNTIEGWSRALDLRDRETESHTQRVTDLTLQIAHRLGLPEERLVHIRRGALLHDIGKMGVPDRILHKPDTLSPEEWTVMRMHPVYAYEMLLPISYLRPALSIPYCHHEWWDGSGYPRGLKGEEIPLEARIFAIVDTYDALTSTRPYRAAWPRTQALRQIMAESGTHFDPDLVDEFLRIVTGTGPL